MTAGTYTTRDLITAAYRKIGVVAEGETMNADQAATGLAVFNRLMKGWQNRGAHLWSVSEISVELTTATTYELDPRPLELHSVSLRRDGIDTPMQAMTRDSYDRLPLKSSLGLPTTWYFNRQRETATITIWPALAVANDETLRITLTREFLDIDDHNEAPDIPGEWWDAAVYNVAARLCDDYSRDLPYVRATARELEEQALAFDREGSVFFGSEPWL
jgi:hypothetical protein